MASSGSEQRPGGPASRRTPRRPRPYWWQELRRPDGVPLPPNAAERPDWYERQLRSKRTGYYAIEVVILAVSASVPAAVAAGASAAVAGVLGALVTALVGARQLFRLEENWIGFNGARIALQAEVVSYSVASPPYDDPATAAATLATTVERIVATETARWSTLREQHRQPPKT